MKCDCCPLRPLAHDDDCPDSIELKDGTYGCKKPWNKIHKLDMEYGDYLGRVGTDMGQQMQAEYYGVSIEDIIDTCKHMIGLDNIKPYRRHGKAYYRPYRNYFCAGSGGEKTLNALLSDLVHREECEQNVWYYLTRAGLDWLGRRLNITIYDSK